MRFSLLLMFAICLAMVSGRASAQSLEEAKTENGLAQLTASDTKLRAHEKIAFFGDSVTLQGGYIQLIDKALKESTHTKPLEIQLFPHGLNGGRVPTVLEGKSPWGDLGGTMDSLLQSEKPTIVVIYLGINDVWHGEQGTKKPEFEAGLRKMIAMSQQINAAVVLCTPTVIGEETENNDMNRTLGQYSDIIRQLALDEKLVLCDLHRAFLEKLAKINPENQHAGNLTYDGVHMNDRGNELLADLISQGIMAATKSR